MKMTQQQIRKFELFDIEITQAQVNYLDYCTKLSRLFKYQLLDCQNFNDDKQLMMRQTIIFRAVLEKLAGQQVVTAVKLQIDILKQAEVIIYNLINETKITSELLQVQEFTRLMRRKIKLNLIGPIQIREYLDYVKQIVTDGIQKEIKEIEQQGKDTNISHYKQLQLKVLQLSDLKQANQIMETYCKLKECGEE
ncbi:Hypothetical_protein [Hexamita inflata]|uniref:Hypothetical_protein n=1 Tax=Hexamita inflata TaxID=28002 RepID=A0AA86U9V9_9EUKA|nr:Hypothetical protein HINF_LOCUS30707 [Hexamita inflata]